MNDEQIFNSGFPVGMYRDAFIDLRGRLLWESPWQQNLIVDSLRRLIAALLKGDPAVNHLGYWAIGAGNNAWDNGPLPADNARRTLTQLYKEVGRKPIQPGQMIYLGGPFTNQLEITMEFTIANIPIPGPGNANYRLREFGLFAGGTAAANSGVLINHRIHPRIDMQAGFTLQRTLHLTF